MYFYFSIFIYQQLSYFVSHVGWFTVTTIFLLHRLLQEYPGGIISISQGSFNIDETLGGEVKFALTYYDLGHVGNMVSLIDPNGHGVKTLHSLEEDGDVNTIFITLRDAKVSLPS